MQWSELKIYKNEELMQEVEAAEAKYKNMLNRINAADKDDEEPKREFYIFREQIEMRVLELDEFYQLNQYDPRIIHFGKIRNRLAALLDTNIKIEGKGGEIVKKTYEIPQDALVKNKYKNIKGNYSNKAALYSTPSKLSKSKASVRHSTMRSSSRMTGM